MNKEELMTKVVEWTGETAEKIGDFAAKEIPPFIHEYLQWKFWENAIGVGFYLILIPIFIAAVIGLYKAIQTMWKKKKENPYSDWEVPATLLTIFGGIGAIGLFIIGISNFPTDKILDCVQIKLAPKVYLIQQASEIIKENK